MSIEVTVRDTETGETETKTITDYVVVCASTRYISNVQRFPKTGTAQITIRVKT